MRFLPLHRKRSRPPRNQRTAEEPATVDQNDLDPRALVPDEEAIQPKDARTAAWASFVQALLGSGEFQLCAVRVTSFQFSVVSFQSTNKT